MRNHIHLIAVPPTAHALRGAIADTHYRYTRLVNARNGWMGHLWQDRFASCALDAAHLLAAIRYVELNPVRARLVAQPQDWLWSSARAHLTATDDALVTMPPILANGADWPAFLDKPPRGEELDALRRHERTGRPLGSSAIVIVLEERLGRCLGPRNRGPARPARPLVRRIDAGSYS
jgi:putative transposase